MDPELEDLFRDDPELRETARLLLAVRPDPEPDPYFRNRLRARLVTEAQRSLRPRGLRSWLRIGPGYLAWGGATLGTVAIAATAVALFGTRVVDHQTVTAYSTIAARHSVSPSDVITVAFNQPMNHTAVEAGLHIEPATQVTTSWRGNELVITPLHHLAGNTPYTVTIAKPALVASSGATAAKQLQISFGTAPTPPPAPVTSPLPTLQLNDLGPVLGDSSLLFAPDGSVVSTAGYPPATTSTPGPGATAAPSGSPTSSPTGTAAPPSTSPSPAGATSSPALLHYASSAVTYLGPAATTAAFAPGGGSLAAVVSDANGGSKIVASQPDGTKPHVLLDSAAPIVALTWATGDRIVYATSSTIASVDLSGSRSLITTPSGNVTELAPGGGFAYLAPSAGQPGLLLDVNTGATRALRGATSGVVFSGDGATIAWVSSASSQPAIVTEPVAQDAAASVSTQKPGASIGSLALNHNGTEIAYSLTPGSGAAQLVVAQLPSGTPVATGPATSYATFSAKGDALAVLTQSAAGFEAELASITGSTPGTTPTIPAAASSAVGAFVDAQARGDAQTLAALSSNGVAAAASTPSGLSRSYIVDTVVQSDGSVLASVELIVDPTATGAARVADETLTLSSSGAGQPYLVTALTITPLHHESLGPHVVNVGSTRSHTGFLVQISFDSDLNPLTVPGAFTVVTADGTQLTPTISYNPDTRTAVIALPAGTSGRLTVSVGSALRDVNGQPIASTFSTGVVAG